MAQCIIDGCQAPVKIKSRGLCSRHYTRWQRHGDPMVTLPHNRPSKALPGEIYGRLTVLNEAGHNRHGQRQVACRCTCGAEIVVPAGRVSGGKTRSCGCLQRDRSAAALRERPRQIVHGRCGTRTYSSWAAMLNRCRNSGLREWDSYGGRGITVCARWQEPDRGFLNFLADMGERPDGTSIDRIDNDGNYEPGNCRWATPKEQRANRRR